MINEFTKYRAAQANLVKTRMKHECIGCLKTFPKGTEMIHASIYPIRQHGLESVHVCMDCKDHEYYKEMLGHIGKNKRKEDEGVMDYENF